MDNASEPAFAMGMANESDNHMQEGLTKREYFAAMAMQGLMTRGREGYLTVERVGEISVEQADALLKALEAS